MLSLKASLLTCDCCYSVYSSIVILSSPLTIINSVQLGSIGIVLLVGGHIDCCDDLAGRILILIGGYIEPIVELSATFFFLSSCWCSLVKTCLRILSGTLLQVLSTLPYSLYLMRAFRQCIFNLQCLFPSGSYQ